MIAGWRITFTGRCIWGMRRCGRRLRGSRRSYGTGGVRLGVMIGMGVMLAGGLMEGMEVEVMADEEDMVGEAVEDVVVGLGEGGEGDSEGIGNWHFRYLAFTVTHRRSGAGKYCTSTNEPWSDSTYSSKTSYSKSPAFNTYFGKVAGPQLPVPKP